MNKIQINFNKIKKISIMTLMRALLRLLIQMIQMKNQKFIHYLTISLKYLREILLIIQDILVYQSKLLKRENRIQFVHKLQSLHMENIMKSLNHIKRSLKSMNLNLLTNQNTHLKIYLFRNKNKSGKNISQKKVSLVNLNEKRQIFNWRISMKS